MGFKEAGTPLNVPSWDRVVEMRKDHGSCSFGEGGN